MITHYCVRDLHKIRPLEWPAPMWDVCIRTEHEALYSELTFDTRQAAEAYAARLQEPLYGSDWGVIPPTVTGIDWVAR